MVAIDDVRQLSREAFASLGLEDIVYVKPIVMACGAIFEIHAADGECLAVVADEATARAAVARHDLKPLRLH
jgi:hypothetical protein